MAIQYDLDSNCYRPERLGIVYCPTTFTPPDRELEKLSDGEIVESALAIKSALVEFGDSVEIIDLGKDRIGSLKKFDWVFNLAETNAGFPLADYEVAGIMEAMGVCFTGSSSATLKACLDKSTTKSILMKNGIKTPAYEVIQLDHEIDTSLDFPLIAKPVHEDGGIGIFNDSVVTNLKELEKVVTRIHKIFNQPALVEEFIEGRDIKVSIIGNYDQIEVMPLSECVYLDPEVAKILTFDANWVTATRAYQTVYTRCPCEIDREVEQSLANIAADVYNFMNCRDYARIDFRLKGETPYVLEVNPNPCINPTGSGFVKACEAYGLNYSDLIAHILTSSIESSIKLTLPDYLNDSVERSYPQTGRDRSYD